MSRYTNVLVFISFFLLSLTSNLNLVHASEVLMHDTWDQKVLQSKDVWFVMFGLPTCGAVKYVQPEWDKAAKAMEGKVKFGEVDCNKNYDLYAKYQIKGFPTIVVFPADKSKGAFVYTGEKTAAAFEEAAKMKLEGKGY